MSGFKTANTVFWCTFFVNQHGCPNALLNPLFKHLSTNNPFFMVAEDHVLEGYQAEFSVVHDQLLKSLIAAIDHYCVEWITSDAGIAWIAYLEKQKYELLLRRLI